MKKNIRSHILLALGIFLACQFNLSVASANNSVSSDQFPSTGLPSIATAGTLPKVSNPGGGQSITLFNHYKNPDDSSSINVGFQSDVWAVSESDDAEIFVYLSGPSDVPVNVDFSTVQGSAIPGVHYSETSGTLLFSPGMTESSFIVPLLNNGDVEDENMLSLILSNPVGADLVENQATATLYVLNDDTESTYSNEFYPSQNENRIQLEWPLSSGTFSVSVEGVLVDPVQLELKEVNFFEDESITAPVDYVYPDAFFNLSLTDTAPQSENVTFSSASLCFPYTEDQLFELAIQEEDLRLLHCKDGLWENVTTHVDYVSRQICGSVDSFSPFVIARDQPVANEETSIEVMDHGISDVLTGDLDEGMGVDGTSLSVDTYDVSFPLVKLSGYSQMISGSPNQSWVAIDSSGAGAGWRVSISATDFSNQSGKIIPVQYLSMRLLDDDIVPLEGNEKPSSTFQDFTTLSDISQVFASAPAGAGMGSYSFHPEFSLVIPANTYNGQYQSIFTVEIVSGP